MNKFAIFAISAAVTASVLAVPIASQEIVVSPRAATAFAQTVEADLGVQLQRVHFVAPSGITGFTSVRFQCGPDGKARNIATFGGTGSRRIDQLGRRAVARLTSLTPQSYGIDEGQLIQANIIVAPNDKQMKRMRDKLERAEADRLARSPREKAVLALTMAGHPVS
ncbi:hypothetical protein K3172_03380 [Qipengyuania sp. 6B39]|uniref:hypothetical protein n=1 Tax=Qipengyuania proteolytica TaxID=2867239 RepID=UPI001C8997E4|nr:hypothetical protein [Qipengyuania proteolytica]MBX7494898.1 hypothetical protein [Qipengyuania proteolytica]